MLCDIGNRRVELSIREEKMFLDELSVQAALKMLLDYGIYWSVGNSAAGLHLKILDRQSHYALDRVQVSDT